MVWFVAGLVPAAASVTAAVRLPSVVTLVGAFVVVSALAFPVFTTVVAVSRDLVAGREVTLKDFWLAWRSYGARSAGVGLLGWGALAVLWVDLLFFLRAPWTAARLLAGVWVWLLAYGEAVMAIAPGILVRLDRGVIQVLKQSALVVLDNAVTVALMLAALLVLAVVSVLLAAPLMLLFAGTGGMIVATVVDEIVQRYRELGGRVGD
ncbi:hypothetical protein U7230_11495 [Carboxydochorda subterranea]|uniref:DUF624 domain-containing protein n=1 Tax=Carboxydichorda subterranea TaxID=3109565 RepID=A0ABZ1BV87_9FIRM|nr:hypothetical protein [Limnochorda sp. L945t]WRP16704.1 hypothetical protein U7230_11495 [Limnochorda sp. L945t]